MQQVNNAITRFQAFPFVYVVRRYNLAEFDDDVWDDGRGDTNNVNDEYKEVDSQTVTVLCDPMRIEQVIMNLVNNAIRHTTVGFVKVRVRRAKFSELASSRHSTASLGDDPWSMDSGMSHRRSETGGEGDNSIVIEVRDSGCGIAEWDRERIFEMFCRGNRGCERYEPGVGIAGGGVGLGLTLCRQLVEAHDSSISVQSVVNVGTAFFFSLARADKEQRMSACREKHVTFRPDDISARADDPLLHVSAAHLTERPTGLSQPMHESGSTLSCSTFPSSNSVDDRRQSIVHLHDTAYASSFYTGTLPRPSPRSPLLGKTVSSSNQGSGYPAPLVHSSKPQLNLNLDFMYSASTSVYSMPSSPGESTSRTSITSPDYHRPPYDSWLGPGDIPPPCVRGIGDELEAQVRDSMQDDERSAGSIDHHDSVTVLVSNIIGFAELSQHCSTSALMLMLNELFSAFDKLLDRYGGMRYS